MCLCLSLSVSLSVLASHPPHQDTGWQPRLLLGADADRVLCVATQPDPNRGLHQMPHLKLKACKLAKVANWQSVIQAFPKPGRWGGAGTALCVPAPGPNAAKR